MYLAGLLIAASTLSRTAYEVSTHRAMGYWAIGRSNNLFPTLHRLEWDQPEITFGGSWLAGLNADLANVGEARLSSPALAHEVIAAGCATEDAHHTFIPSSWRFLNHFLDGVTGAGLGQGLLGDPSDEWGTTHSGNLYKRDQANTYFVKALTERYGFDRERYRVEMLRSLGQVLHLIQDAHQPSHTRDDSHSNLRCMGGLIGPDGYSALELWAAHAVSLDGARMDPTVAAFLGGASATYHPSIGDYIRGSAALTNHDFFSDDTIWQNLATAYPSPTSNNTYLGTEGTWPFEQTYAYASPALHNTIPPLKMARERSGLLAQLNPASPRYTLDDEDVVRGNAAILTQRAVSECAGAINFFFRLGIEADIDTTTQPGEGRLKLTNLSTCPGAPAGDLDLAAGATVQVRYESVSGEVLPIPGLNLPSMPALAAGGAVTLPVDLLGALQPLADPIAYPNPNVRARPDLRFFVVVQGTVGADSAVGGDVWSRECPNNFPTPSGMVAIQSGTFMQGSNAPDGPPYWGEYDDPVVRQVTISYCFWMGETEVTQAQYASLMGTNPSYFAGASNPVERVSWFDAQSYCAALTAQQSALGNVPQGYEYRLPTEAEWEYACRAGTTTEFNVGSVLSCSDALFYYSDHTNSCCQPNCQWFGTAAVRSYAPNAWGLYDMHGNVWEWCLDSYASYTASPVTDPFVTGGPDRVFRGGSWDTLSSYCRSAYRVDYYPGSTGSSVGFRVVLAPVLVP